MKIKLLNDGDHGDMGRVKFPVLVNAVISIGTKAGKIATVSGDELERVGGHNFSGQSWTFYASEYEVVQ